MGTFKVNRSEWTSYFDAVTKHVQTKDVSVIVEGLDLGVQVEAEKLKLVGLTYDSHDDALAISFDALHHRISHPKEIWVKEDERGQLESFEVIDDDEHTQIVEIVPALPAP